MSESIEEAGTTTTTTTKITNRFVTLVLFVGSSGGFPETGMLCASANIAKRGGGVEGMLGA
jgi:hypothetical protein